MSFLSEAFTLDWQQAIIDLLRVILSLALTMPVAWFRNF